VTGLLNLEAGRITRNSCGVSMQISGHHLLVPGSSMELLSSATGRGSIHRGACLQLTEASGLLVRKHNPTEMARCPAIEGQRFTVPEFCGSGGLLVGSGT